MVRHYIDQRRITPGNVHLDNFLKDVAIHLLVIQYMVKRFIYTNYTTVLHAYKIHFYVSKHADDASTYHIDTLYTVRTGT